MLRKFNNTPLSIARAFDYRGNTSIFKRNTGYNFRFKNARQNPHHFYYEGHFEKRLNANVKQRKMESPSQMESDPRGRQNWQRNDWQWGRSKQEGFQGSDEVSGTIEKNYIWGMLGTLGLGLGLIGLTQAQAEENKKKEAVESVEAEKLVRLNRENYKFIIAKLKENDPKLLSIIVDIRLNSKELRELYEAINDNANIGYIEWHEDQVVEGPIGLINEKLIENNKNYKYYPTDYVHVLLSAHVYIDSKVNVMAQLDEDKKGLLKNWRVERVYDDIKTTGYYGAIYVNDKTHQIVLASRGSESILDGLFNNNSDWKTNLEEIVAGKIIPGQQAWNYRATKEAVKLAKEKGYNLSLTGHSLGAWLAEMGAYYCHAYFNHPNVKAVTFDSPGSKQMMKQLGSNIESRDTVVNRKDIDIVTYLAGPNPINSCNGHVGKVYRVNREMPITQWMDNKIPSFIMDKLGNKLHGAISIEGHTLGGILDTFDPETGKPRKGDYTRIASWPRLEYHGKGISVAKGIQGYIVADTTIMSLAGLLTSVMKGEIYQGEYWEYFKHIDTENADGKSEPKKNLSFDDDFALAAKARYREDNRNILKLSKGSVDELLYELYLFRETLHTFKNLPKIVSEQLKDLANSFEVKAIGEQGKKYALISKKLDVDEIRERMRRLKAVIPNSVVKLRILFYGTIMQSTSLPGSIEKDFKGIKNIPHGIPSIRDKIFIEKKEELKKIERKLEKDDMVIICGPSGVGKTSLVEKYARDLKDQGGEVRWIDATSNVIENAWAKFADALEIKTGGLTIDQIKNIIYRKLGKTKKLVHLILDNVDKEEDVLRFLEDRPTNVKVLITTQNKKLFQDKGYRPIELVGFTKDDAINFCNKKGLSLEQAKELVEGLLRNNKELQPQFLKLAVVYLYENTTTTVREYLNEPTIYGDRGVEILINRLNEDEKRVLTYCAYLDADEISIDLLKDLIKDKENLNKSIKKLEEMDLITMDGRATLSLHEKVQKSIKEKSLDPGLLKELLHKMVELFPDCSKYDEEKIKKANQLIKNADNIANAIEKSFVINEEARILFSKLGAYYQHGIIVPKQSLAYYEQSLRIARHLHPENHLDVATAYNSLGEAYQILGNSTEALENYKRALKMRKALYIGNHADIASSLNNIGNAYNVSGDFDHALEYHEQALKMRKALYTGNNADLATSFDNMGSTYYYLGDGKKALEYYEQALEMREAIHPKNHPDVASSLGSLGIAYNALGDRKRALEYHERALKIRKAIYPENHPNVALSLNNIGGTYYALGDRKKALEYHEQALKIWSAIYPENHPMIAISLNNIGNDYRALKDGKKALEYHERALKIRKAIYPENHPEVAGSLYNIGKAYDVLENSTEALRYHKRALKIRKAIYSENHPDVADSLNGIGKAYYALKKTKEALEYHERALKMQETVYPKGHADIAESLYNVGMTHSELGDNRKALESFKQAYSIAATMLGYTDTDTLRYKKKIEEIQTDFFSTHLKEGAEMLFREGCNDVGNECRTIIPRRGDFGDAIFDVKKKLQTNVLNGLQEAAEKGRWKSKYSLDYFEVLGDWGIVGYSADSYIQRELGSDNNPKNFEIAKMLCFEAINLGIMKSPTKPYTMVQEFTKANPELVKKIAAEHPEYFVDGSIVEACIRAVPNDSSFKEHLLSHTGIFEFKARS